jgi:thioredoxin reductase
VTEGTDATSQDDGQLRPADDRRYDVVVVGGGPAGLSGALSLGRARRSVVVVDAGDPRNAPATGVHNYLAREGVPPADLLAAGRAEIAAYGVRVISGTATNARRRNEPSDTDISEFEVDLADGRAVRGRRLLVTTGLVDELPQVAGLAERWGRDVLHCPYCHGWEMRDRKIGVLATGPMAVQKALLWRQWSPHITLLLPTAAEPTDQQCEELAARDIAVVHGQVAALEIRDDRLTGVRLDDGQFIAIQALAVSPHFTARSGFLAGLQLAPADLEVDGYVLASRIPADAMGATSVPGVWVAGNVADPYAHVLSSAAGGLTAGAAINADLIAEDTRLAVTAYRAERETGFRPANRGSGDWPLTG